MTVQFMKIEPALAEQWFATTIGNPRWKTGKLVDRTRVSIIADDIRNGNWKPSNNSIAFDKQGRLVDGHHRLAAIIEAGIPVYSLVVFGIDEAALQHIDENKSRTISQRTHIHNKIVAAVNVHFWILRQSMTKPSESSVEIKKFVDRHPAVFEAFKICGSGANHAICQRSYSIHAVTCALEYGVDESRLVEFCEAVNSGFADIRTGTSAIVCRNMMLKDTIGARTRGNKIFMDYCVQNAIRDFMDSIPRRNAYKPTSGYYFDELARMGKEDYKK